MCATIASVVNETPPPRATLIRDLPLGDRPRERLRDAGAQSLSTAELLAILLRVGSAKENALAQASRLLARFGGLPDIARASFAELCGEDGIGEAKAAQIQAALELGMRLAATTSGGVRPMVRTPDDIAGLYLAEMSLLDQEQVRVVLLDSRNRVIATPMVFKGTVHTSQVRVAELLSPALRAHATAIVLLHNHPSGDPTPSAADIQITQTLFDAATLMGIELYDHIIIGGGTYASMSHLRLGMKRRAASAAGR
jgi:DNA repair protein RadC